MGASPLRADAVPGAALAIELTMARTYFRLISYGMAVRKSHTLVHARSKRVTARICKHSAFIQMQRGTLAQTGDIEGSALAY